MSDFSTSFGQESGFSKDKIDYVTSGFIEERICGEGGSCKVYRMLHNGLLVAVKRLNPEYRHRTGYVDSYRKEFQIGQRLKHDAIPIYRSLRDDSEEVYIEMDYIDGVTVKDFVRTPEGKEYFRSPENVRRFLSELVNVTCYMHRCGVIHCDLKPANIMLRHSDRGLMLIDLDKAYSDTMNDTHGGTFLMSDPLESGQKPTVYKDFSAIGKILDNLTMNVPGFPISKFRRFRKLCDDRNVTEKALSASLRPKNYSKYLVMTGGLFATLAIAFFMFYNGSSESFTVKSSDEPASQATAVSKRDTIVIVEQYQAKPTPPSDSIKVRKAPTVAGIDIDKEMGDFIVQVKDAQTSLENGIGGKDLNELLLNLNMSYLDAYHKIVKDCKSRNPDKLAVDVELEVARAWEKSQAGQLFIKFNETVRDTLNQREQGAASDYNLK